MKIRELDPERDAPGVVEIVRERSPAITVNVASWLHRERTTPDRCRARSWVAEVGGRVAGYVETYLHPFNGDLGHAYVNVEVAAAHGGRGIGAALFEHGEAYARTLDPKLLVTAFTENDDGVRFAEQRGLSLARAEQIAVVDPRNARETPPDGVDLRTARDIDPHDLYVVDEASVRDMPALGEIAELQYDEWRTQVLDHPLFTLDGTFVAYVDGEPAACSMLTVDEESGRSTNFYTGTIPAFRGRGLGRAVKLASVRWAAARGVSLMATTNDETNAPMLAINRRLGYRPAGRRVEYAKDVR